MSSNIEHCQLVVVVALIEYRKDFLLMRRHDPQYPQWHRRWEFPGGKINPYETPLEALHREVKEETGLVIHSEKFLGVHTHHWHVEQKVQQTFLLLYHGQSSHGEVHLNQDENDAYLWEAPEAILRRPDLLGGCNDMIKKFLIPNQGATL